MFDLENATTYYLFQAALTGLLWFAAIDFVMGLGLIFIPQQMFRANEVLRKWVSFRRPFKAFNFVFRIEPFIYRFPRTFGIIFTAYALLAVYWLTFVFSLRDTVMTYSAYFNSGSVEYIARGLYIIFLGFSVISIIVGVILITNPKQMEAVDKKLNTWVSIRSMLKPIETMNETPDQFIKKYPRLVGALVCVACLYFFGSVFYFNWFIYLKF